MAVTVNMFNADVLPINVNVNNGPLTFPITAAAAPSWLPGVPAINPGFNPGPPIPGFFGVGTNRVVLTPQGAPSPFIAPIELPGTVNWSSIQIYVFFQSYDSCSWLVLNAGAQVSQASTFSEARLRML
jgi:hypothetical protein